MEDPLITTIIPTFRRPQLLKRAIESALNQTIRKNIVYISDNASGDETKDVVEEYRKQDPRVNYFCQKHNVGLAQNFADALTKVQTPYFSFLQDDDFLLPWFYQTALEGFAKYPEAGFSSCRTLVIDAKGKLVPSQFTLPVSSGFFSVPESLATVFKSPLAPALWNGTLYKTDILKKIGGIEPQTGTAMDFAFTVKCTCAFPFVITSKPAAVLVVWPKSTTFSQSDTDSDNLELVYKNIELYLDAPQAIRQKMLTQLRQLQLSGVLRTWIRLLAKGKIDQAKKARMAFQSLGGKGGLQRILFWIECFPFLSKGLLFAFVLRKLIHKLFAWSNEQKDPERDLYIQWAKANKQWITTCETEMPFSLKKQNK